MKLIRGVYCMYTLYKDKGGGVKKDKDILVYKFRPKKTGFNMYAEYNTTAINFPCITTLKTIKFASKMNSIINSVTSVGND